jgi:catechol 2,3-dioxygenase-like lactoylglutathione lyase family enzyme
VIAGAHALLYAEDPEAARSFFRDVLGFPSVDAGGGWLIFALPPGELACHPAEQGGTTELFLMCRDLEDTIRRLTEARVTTGPIDEERWGRIARVEVPGFGPLGLYEPHHPSPLDAFK